MKPEALRMRYYSLHHMGSATLRISNLDQKSSCHKVFHILFSGHRNLHNFTGEKYILSPIQLELVQELT